nr:MAG: putative maturation protein [Leviviridae sp.]
MRRRTRWRGSTAEADTTISQGGDAYPHYTTHYVDGYSPFGQTMTDVVGNRSGDNDMTSETYEITPAFYNCERRWIIHPSTPDRVGYQQVAGFDTPRLEYYFPESDEEFVTRAVAETNPSAADFDVPIFIGELRDLPRLFQNASRSMSKAAAGEYLKFEYGIKPLISDIRKFLKVSARLQKRIENIRRLQKNHVLVRTYRPPNRFERYIADNGYVDAWAHAPLNDYFQMRISGDVSMERWATVKWVADDPRSLPVTDTDMMRQAQRVAFGGTVDGSTLWELMPWSWLIDWNTNLGDFIESKRNIVGASPGSICLMKTIHENSFPYFDRSMYPPLDEDIELTISSTVGRNKILEKSRNTRIRPQAITTGEINLLGDDVRKQSILSALAVQRLKGFGY